MRMIRHLALASLMLTLAACASRPEAMTASAPAEARSLVHSSPLFQSTSVGKVSIAKEKGASWEFTTVDLYRQALEQSLEAAGLLAKGKPATYVVDVQLIDTDQPIVGIDMSVTSTIDYNVHPALSDSPVFKERIVAPFTTKFSEAFVGAERARLANEGSIRANIEKFLGAVLRAVKAKPAGTPTS